ncbi:unnamed protein product [Gongylonema pulchrum]|nr:unnamed protein product [Gongylonema pulchrum]
MDISSTIDSNGRLTVEARKQPSVQGRERMVPVEGPSRRAESYNVRNEATRSRQDSGAYGTRAQQQPLSGHRSHSSYSYHHSRTTGGSPSGHYREHDVPITQTGMSSRATGERIPSG